MNLLLDTCAVLWSVSAPDRLTETARNALESPENTVSVCAISCAEIACGVDRGRIELDRHWKTWFRHYLDVNGWACLPIDQPVMEEAYSLPAPFHADPADRTIVAAARIHGMAVVTGDRRILAYPHVEHCW